MADERSDSFENSVFKSIRWNLILSFAGQLANIGVTLVLSRLLDPSDFGMLAAALALVLLIEVFGSLGSASALTQRQNPSDQFYSAVLVVTGCSAAFMMLIIWGLSPYLASFYQNPDLSKVFFLLSLSIPFQFLETFPLAELQRRLAFDKIAITSFFGIVLAGGISIYLASKGYGWMALVVRLFLLQSIRTVWFCIIAWPKFAFKPRLQEMRDLLHFGVPQSFSQFLFSFGRKIDDILIGKWMGTSALGVYNLAYGLYMWPVSNIKGRISQVIFAAMSKVQTDTAAMGSYYLKTVSLTTLIGFPVIIGFASVCDLAVPVIMGEKWISAVPVLRILGLASLFEICVFPGAIYQATGRTRTFLKMTIITRTVAVAGIVIGLNFGLEGVSSSIVGSSFVSFFIYNHFIRKLIPVDSLRVLKVMGKNCIPSLVMLAAVLTFRFSSGRHFSDATELIISLLIGMSIYGVVILKFHPEVFGKNPFSTMRNSGPH